MPRARAAALGVASTRLSGAAERVRSPTNTYASELEVSTSSHARSVASRISASLIHASGAWANATAVDLHNGRVTTPRRAISVCPPTRRLLVHPCGLSQAWASVARSRAPRWISRASAGPSHPGLPDDDEDVIAEELHVGTDGLFADAGFAEVSRPTLRRLVMRIDF